MGNRGTRTFPGKLRSDVRDFPAAGTGTLANRPLPRFPGRMYVATDIGNIAYIDTGSAWIALPSPRLVAHDESDFNVSNTTAEFDFFNTTVPAGLMLAGDSLHLHARGAVYNITGIGVTIRWRLYLNGVVMADSGATDNIATGSLWRWFHFDWDLSLLALTATWSRATLTAFMADPAAMTTFVQSTMIRQHGNTDTINQADWATATALRFTGTLSTASPNAYMRRSGFYLNRLPG